MKATLTDKAGNVSPEGQDSAVMATPPPPRRRPWSSPKTPTTTAPSDRTEISVPVGVQVTLPAGAVAGDVLTVSGQAPITLTRPRLTASS
ncbi:hypothetical protein [Aeromonas caviae]|uniref:hypothetical protein n=1 Tax=Aeromonas caviae TaxID=648 RepID=UPI000A4F1C1B|nr:hypothetical protein [Aeromonas caviae]